MPKKLSDHPKPLQPYIFHGLDLSYAKGDQEATSDCPFCDREEKFTINIETGQWRCFVCGGGQDKGGGGIFQFLESLFEIAVENTTDYKALAQHRNILPETLMQWEVCKSPITDHWMVPGWGKNKQGKVVLRQLYVYRKSGEGMILLATPTGRKNDTHALFGGNLFNKSREELYLCEGPWDAMRLWETLKSTKGDDDGNFTRTANQDRSLLGDANVLAVPGCNTFHDHWKTWFDDKYVRLLYDNDWPVKTVKGKITHPAGTAGMKRCYRLIGEAAYEVLFTYWGSEGYTDQLSNGYDIRDMLGTTEAEALEGLSTMFAMLQEIPNDWKKDMPQDGGDDTKVQPCASFKKLVLSWRKSMKWIDGLDHALVVMLASISSTNSIGDQLWVKIVGPASCGKSTLCEAVSINTRHTVAKSTIRGFHSGYRAEGGNGEDNSLLATLNGKTLITKDGDTLLQSPNLGQILAEARDVYDGVSRTHYRNKASKDYIGFRTTWILCGTSSLRSIDSSELGERFLDCVIMDSIDEETEDDILWRTANRSAEHIGILSNGERQGQTSKEMTDSMQLTGGYIDWLKNNAGTLLPQIAFSTEAKQQCLHFGKFVAYMRARPSKHQNESGERELAARLVSQHVRLSKCVALVLQENSVNDKVLKRVRRVCLDTARGIVFDITRALYESGSKGMQIAGLLLRTHCADAELRLMMRFLCSIGVAKIVMKERKKMFVITPPIKNLYERVVLEL